MPDWEIIRIKDDPAAVDTPRWTIVYSVPTEYSPDGVFSHSTPKSILNTYAAAFEYDVEDETQVGLLFDHVMTRPMLTAQRFGPPAPDSLAKALERRDAVADALSKAAEACKGRQVYLRDPAELRADVAAGIAHMKRGLARLKPAAQVELHEAGRFVGMADLAENPKYILMRDMVSRLRPDLIEVGRRVFREQRALRMAEQTEAR
ncbi:hypothetical protein [Nonomuraea sp. NPDC050786]|uniref:hypothetical protein n=1 Tax=Nonomuraea sp. NPDC050786 TaxID=3154840 RepID=UPI0033EE6179